MTAPGRLDTGADGPAARARPGAVVRVEGEWRGSVRNGAVDAFRYSDSTLHDRMHKCGQLSDRQHEAAERLASMYGALPRSTSRYGENAGGDEEPDSRADYRAALRSLPSHQASLIDALVLAEQHPGRRLSECQAGLETLGLGWGID